MNRTPDFLIIGQGLAGSLLAWELIKRKQQVIIVDNGEINASQVAAGLINPVTGMRFVKSFDVDLLLPFAKNSYQQLTQYFQQDFYIEKTMLRLLRNEKELLACQKRLIQPDYQQYLEKITASTSSINASHGILNQTQTGYLLTQSLLSNLKHYFISNNCYIKTHICYDEITLSPIVRWKNFQPKNIIFCEGHMATHNPWFSYLPFQAVKGEIITATSTQPIQQNILNYGHWFIPLDDYQFRTGATFDREDLSSNTSQAAKETLLSSLKQAYTTLPNSSIVKHQAGVRPSTLDKQPFIGKHPQHNSLHIFNGFGAKGSLQIPFYCHALANSLLVNETIPSSCNILRYNSLYST